MEILSIERLTLNGSQQIENNLGDKPKNTNIRPGKSKKIKTKYIKLYELTQTISPVDKPKSKFIL
jgi:hypothetical protein